MDIVINANCTFSQDGVNEGVCYYDFYIHALLALGFSLDNLPLLSLINAYEKLITHPPATHPPATSRGLSAGSIDNVSCLNPADKPRDVEIGRFLVSPVIWEASHNDAMIVSMGDCLKKGGGAHLDEAFEGLRAYFAEDNASLNRYDDTHWLLTCDAFSDIDAPSLPAMFHQSMMKVINQLDKTHEWARRLTEIQMLFASTPTCAPINGVWVSSHAIRATTVRECDTSVRVTLPYGHGSDGSSILVDDNTLANWLKHLGLAVTHITEVSKRLSYDVIILRDANQLTALPFYKKLQQQKIQWYWNDSVYETHPSRWWTRIWNAHQTTRTTRQS